MANKYYDPKKIEELTSKKITISDKDLRANCDNVTYEVSMTLENNTTHELEYQSAIFRDKLQALNFLNSWWRFDGNEWTVNKFTYRRIGDKNEARKNNEK